MLTNETLRDYLRETLEYLPQKERNPLAKESLLVQIARKQLENADDETVKLANENLIKLNKQFRPFYSNAEIKKEGLTKEELSENLYAFLPRIDNIIWCTKKNVGPVIESFIDDMCEYCGFDTI